MRFTCALHFDCFAGCFSLLQKVAMGMITRYVILPCFAALGSPPLYTVLYIPGFGSSIILIFS